MRFSLNFLNKKFGWLKETRLFGGQTHLSFFFHFTFLRRIFVHFGLLKVFSFMFRETKEGPSSRTEDRLFGDSCNLKEIKERNDEAVMRVTKMHLQRSSWALSHQKG